MKTPTEADYTTTVIQMAQVYGWLAMHQRRDFGPDLVARQLDPGP